MALRRHEANLVVDAQRAGDVAEMRELAVAVRAARTAHDEEQRAWVVERGERLDREVRTLQRLDAPDEQEHPPVTDAERVARTRAVGVVAGREQLVVDAGRDDLHALGVRGVEVDELVALLDSRRAQQVAAADHLLLDARTVARVVRAVDAGGRLDPRERVERRRDRDVELVLETVADRARDPVVPVQDVVLDVRVPLVCERRVDELVDELVERMLRDGRARPGRQMDHTEAGLDVDDGPQTGTVGARQHVALDARARERRRERVHVHVEPPAVARARLRERRRVHAEDPETPDHAAGDRSQGTPGSTVPYVAGGPLAVEPGLALERPVDLDERLLLPVGDGRVTADRGDEVGRVVALVEDPGLDVQRLGRDLQTARDRLQDLRARLAQTPLDLAQVRVRDPRELAQLPQRQPVATALVTDERAELAQARLEGLGCGHADAYDGPTRRRVASSCSIASITRCSDRRVAETSDSSVRSRSVVSRSSSSDRAGRFASVASVTSGSSPRVHSMSIAGASCCGMWLLAGAPR